MVTIRCRQLQPLAATCSRLPKQPLAATWQPLAATRRHLPHVAAATGCKWLQEQAASGCKWLLEQVAASGCFFEDQNDARLLAFCNLEKKENRKIYKHTFFSSSRWHIAANGYDSLQTAAATWRPLGSHLLRQPLGSHSQPLAQAATWQPLADTCPKWLQQVAAKWLPDQVAAKWLQVADMSKITMMHVCSLSAISNFKDDPIYDSIIFNIFDFLLLFAR